MKPAPIPTTELTVTRMISAPPQDIYDVWIDPKSPGGPWYGAAKAIVNATLDGLFYSSVEFEGQNWAHYGRFTKLERGHLIEHTWVSPATKGLESIVSLTFVANGTQTEVTLRHSGVPDDEMGRMHGEGWTWVLSMLDESLTKKQAVLR
jgi:uncharacterized protein YndB with AHSA1/START domain